MDSGALCGGCSGFLDAWRSRRREQGGSRGARGGHGFVLKRPRSGAMRPCHEERAWGGGCGRWGKRWQAGPGWQRLRHGEGAVAVAPIELGRPKRRMGGGKGGKASRPRGRKWASRPKMKKGGEGMVFPFLFPNHISKFIFKEFLNHVNFESRPIIIKINMQQHVCIKRLLTLYLILISQKLLISYI